MSAHVFVYGTLLPEFDHRIARAFHRAATVVGSATLRGRLYIVNGYPGVVAAPDARAQVHGVVYRLNEHNLFRLLDAYEGYKANTPEASLYVRRGAHVTLDTGQTMTATVYFYNRPVGGCEEIKTGCYRSWLKNGRR